MQNARCVSSLARQIPACPRYSVLLSSLDTRCHLFTILFNIKGVPAHGQGDGTRWSLKLLTTQTILWSYFSIKTWLDCNKLPKTPSKITDGPGKVLLVTFKESKSVIFALCDLFSKTATDSSGQLSCGLDRKHWHKLMLSE